MRGLNETHDPGLRSWVSSAQVPEGDFPIQNLPFGRFRAEPGEPWRTGVAIGDQVLDLQAAGLLDHADMARVLALPADQRSALRLALSRGLREGSREQAAWSTCLFGQSSVELGLPCEVGDYTDFYIGIHHAMAVGRLLRPDNPLLPNYKWVPIGYHGRSSTLMPSGAAFVRPRAQVKTGEQAPVLQATARLDFELEMGVVIGPGNPMGEPVDIEAALDHVFGLTLLNDWSARDVQGWEYQPLGPFLAKNFATTVSPWIVTLEALTPYRRPFGRPEGDPQPLPYLQSMWTWRCGYRRRRCAVPARPVSASAARTLPTQPTGRWHNWWHTTPSMAARYDPVISWEPARCRAPGLNRPAPCSS
jgi:fumarylacetoacetase